MNKWTCRGMAFGLLLIWSGATRAEEKPSRAIIEKAVQAAGGQEQLAKYQAMTFKEKGTFYGEATPQPYTAKYAVQLPDRYRMEIEGAFTIIFDGNQGWIVRGGKTQEMNKEQLAEQKQSQYVAWVTSLLPLLKGKAFQLSPLGESKDGDQTVIGVKVSHPGQPDVRLYFSRDSGLMVKSDFHIKEWRTGKEVEMVNTYSHYKQSDGFEFPTKIEMKRAGKQYVQAEIEEVKPLEKPDAKLFAKP